MVPTALHHYTVAEIEAMEKGQDPPHWAYNANLGRFTNFVNLMDMCGVSVPTGILSHVNLGKGHLVGESSAAEDAGVSMIV